MRVLDPDAVYEKALAPPTAVDELDELELVVYAIKELEVYNAMQGWDGLFIGSCAYLGPIVRRCLAQIGDSASLAVVEDYVRYLAEREVPFEAAAIEAFVCGASDAELRAQPDWGARFEALTAERWACVERYLRSRGVALAVTGSRG